MAVDDISFAPIAGDGVTEFVEDEIEEGVFEFGVEVVVFRLAAEDEAHRGLRWVH